MDNYTSRKAKTGELKKIVEVANAAFAPVRFEGYDFVKTMPKIYASKKGYSDIHHICEVDGKFVAVCGNWIRKIEIGKNSYPFSFVGTVATRPEFQGQGCMRALMEAAEQECYDKNVVFCALTGDKEMYAHFGFEQAGYFCVYEFDKSFAAGESVGNIEICEMTKNKAKTCYEIYRNAQIFNLRSKNTFMDCVGDYRAKVFMICENGAQIGYFVLKKGEIIEFYSKNLNLMSNIISNIISYLGADYVRFVINPLHVALNEKLGEIARACHIKEEIQFKVFDWKKFVEMLFEVNKNFREFQNAKEVFGIDGEFYMISISNNNISVQKTTDGSEAIANFSSKEFVRFALRRGEKNSKIFPMIFGFDMCDMF